jgi:hypothetical protein
MLNRRPGEGSLRRALLLALVGGWWGCGHTLSLLLAGLIVTLLGFDLREEDLRPLNLLIAAMLIALGSERAAQARGRTKARERKQGTN